MTLLKNRWWYIDGPEYSMDPALAEWVVKPRPDNNPSLKEVVPFRIDPQSGEELPITIDEVQQEYLTKWNFDIPLVFDTIREIVPAISRSFLVYAKKGSTVTRHIHPPVYDNTGLFVRPRRTVTIGIPVKTVGPTPDLLYFYHTAIDYTGINFKTTDVQALYEIHNKIIQVGDKPTDIINMPNSGQYLVLDFDSSNTVHWGIHTSDNEFLFLVCDI